jgi:hypothetical protein
MEAGCILISLVSDKTNRIGLKFRFINAAIVNSKKKRVSSGAKNIEWSAQTNVLCA